MANGAFQNVLNIVVAVIAALIAFDWSVVVSPETGGAIIGGLSALKLAINAFKGAMDKKTGKT